MIGYFHVSVIFRLSASTATARACSSEPNHAAEYCAVTALAASARSERLTRLTFSPLAASTLRSSLGKLRRLSGRDFDATLDSEPPRGEGSPLSSSLLAVLCDVSFPPPSVLLLRGVSQTPAPLRAPSLGDERDLPRRDSALRSRLSTSAFRAVRAESLALSLEEGSLLEAMTTRGDDGSGIASPGTSDTAGGCGSAIEDVPSFRADNFTAGLDLLEAKTRPD